MKVKIVIIALLSVVLVNCSSKSGSNDAGAPAPIVAVPGTGPWTPPVDGPGQGPGHTFTYGGTSTFMFDSKGVYNQYTMRNIGSLAELSNVKINLNFDKYNSTYGGTVTIRYNHQGLTYEGFFTSGNDASTNRYNVFFTKNSQLVFHGFFEDFRGAIVVVIDDAAQLLDGVSAQDTVSGSVWFKNFGYSQSPHPATYCWFVHNKPTYDCRAWKDGDGVDTIRDIYPDSGYTRLGTFTGMPATAAFNGLIF
ncbi:MAG: hypothetical protein KF799_16410 [Bdellovibrionales bacterium]|nr:hypothetical protein [Bdellovibrionales bacterium]